MATEYSFEPSPVFHEGFVCVGHLCFCFHHVNEEEQAESRKRSTAAVWSAAGGSSEQESVKHHTTWAARVVNEQHGLCKTCKHDPLLKMTNKNALLKEQNRRLFNTKRMLLRRRQLVFTENSNRANRRRKPHSASSSPKFKPSQLFNPTLAADGTIAPYRLFWNPACMKRADCSPILLGLRPVLGCRTIQGSITYAVKVGILIYGNMNFQLIRTHS